jgi:hypothetical protein
MQWILENQLMDNNTEPVRGCSVYSGCRPHGFVSVKFNSENYRKNDIYRHIWPAKRSYLLLSLSQILFTLGNTFLLTMSMLKKIAVILFISAVIIGAGSVKVTKFEAGIPAQSQNTIELVWSVDSEQNVKHYRVERKMLSDNNFSPVHTEPSAPQGSGTYTWRDTGVFKANSDGEPVVYELYAVFADNSEQYIDQASVNFTSTAIRRTWGSIKAMFQ